MLPRALSFSARIIQIVLFVLLVSSCQDPFFLQTVVDGSLKGDEITTEEAFVDYAVSAPEPSDPEPYTASSLNGSFDLVNTGLTNGVSTVQWAVFASNNAVYNTSDYPVASDSSAPLNGGSGTTVIFSGTWPGSGNYYLIVKISSIDDDNTANNEETSGPYTVQP